MNAGEATIGEYRIERELGRGAMGVVYAARHPEIPRPVAVKLMRRELAESIVDLQRFRREGEMLAKIRHPNVVLVHTLEQVEEGLLLVTDLVEGQDLESLLREGPVPPERAAAIVADLADGVAALHAEGIVHRDLKPANALIKPDGTPILIDFGLAREQDGERLTRTGDLVGTPAYMSPEQALGVEVVGPAADIYGLGGILYALISGRAPFSGVGLLDVLTQITTQGVTPPSHHHQTPSVLESIVLKAMARKPQDRYGSAEAFRAALDAYIARPYEVEESPAGPRVAVGAAALIVVALGIGLFAWSRRATPDPTPASTPVAKTEPPPTAPPPPTLQELVDDAATAREGTARVRAWRALAERLDRVPAASITAKQQAAITKIRSRRLVRFDRLTGGEPQRGALLADDRVVGVVMAPNRAPVLAIWGTDGRALPYPRWRAQQLWRVLALRQGFVWAGSKRAIYRVDDVGVQKRRLLWQVPRSATLQRNRRNSSIRSLAYAPRANLLAVGGDFNEVYLIDADTGRTDLVIPGHQESDVRCIGFTADERYIVTVTSGAGGAGARIYELAALRKPPPEGKKDHEPPGGEFIHEALVLDVAPSGSLLAIGNRRGQVLLLDAAKPRAASVVGPFITKHPWVPEHNQITKRAHAAEMAGLMFVSGKRLLSIGKVGMRKHYHRNWIRAWSVPDRTMQEIRKPTIRASRVSYSTDRRLLLLVGENGIEMWPR